jgi:hypothetical protein
MCACQSVLFSADWSSPCSLSLAANYASAGAAHEAGQSHVSTPARRLIGRLTGRPDPAARAAGHAAKARACDRYAAELLRLLGDATP